MERGSFRSAPTTLLAEDLLALHAEACHAHRRTVLKNWVGFAIASEVPNEDRSVNASEQTTVTIRAAIAAS